MLKCLFDLKKKYEIKSIFSKGEMDDLKGYESCSIKTPKFVEYQHTYELPNPPPGVPINNLQEVGFSLNMWINCN